MARYVATVNSSKSVVEAFAYMADVRNFKDWDRSISKVELIEGDQPGLGAKYDIHIKSGKNGMVLTYTTTEFNVPHSMLIKGRNSRFTSVDLITIEADGAGSKVTYDATLTLNGVLGVFNPFLGRVFNKVGDGAIKGLRKVLA
jgi:hypothetical protein